MAGDGHHILRLAEQLRHQRHATAGLPARALQLVLKIGVFEIFQVQRRCVLHQANAGGIGHAFRQQAVDLPLRKRLPIIWS
jgi:hypothetical protein